jgi:hypothetical protein
MQQLFAITSHDVRAAKQLCAFALGSSSAHRGCRMKNERRLSSECCNARSGGAPTRLRHVCSSQRWNDPSLEFGPSVRSTKQQAIAQKRDASKSRWEKQMRVAQPVQFPATITKHHQRSASSLGERSGSVAEPGIAAVAQVRPQYRDTLYWVRTCANRRSA